MKMSSIFSPYHERYLHYLIHQVTSDAHITIHLKTRATKEVIRHYNPDALIIAAGGVPKALDVPGIDSKSVVSSHDFLEMLNGSAPQGKRGLFNAFMWAAGAVFLRLYYTPRFARAMTAFSRWPISGNVCIIGGGLPGCELGHLCMETNRATTIIEEGKRIGYDVGASDRFGLLSQFKKASHVQMMPNTKVVCITDSGVVAEQTTKEGVVQNVEIPAKTVAITLGLDPNTCIQQELQEVCERTIVVGDCEHPGRIADATKAGYRAICSLEESQWK